MAAEAGWPWEQLRYRIVSAAFHQPALLRAVAAVARRSTGLSSALSLAASAEAVRAVLQREDSFSRDHYPPVMVDGPFVIGLEAGSHHDTRRGGLKQQLPTPEEVATATCQALKDLLPGISKRLAQHDPFDLIDDYMVPLVWSGIAGAYGSEASAKLMADPQLVQAARWVGAQLMVGGVATAAVRQRALRSAALMDAAFGSVDGDLQKARKGCPVDAYIRQRDAIGLLWVGHPATTQGGALVLQELLARPDVYRRLREDAVAADPASASLPSYRDRLREHVLELLRFRPPFPILGRQAPRESEFAVATDAVAHTRPGSVAALAIGALHDPQAQREDPREYAPGRHFHHAADRYLMFGAGPRHCVARDQVQEILVTALAGLLSLDAAQRRPLRYAGPRRRRIVYDGPVIVQMPLRF